MAAVLRWPHYPQACIAYIVFPPGGELFILLSTLLNKPASAVLSAHAAQISPSPLFQEPFLK